VSTSHRPSSSGARISGDAYQHTFSWLHALRLLQPGLDVERIGLEMQPAGNVDDLIVYFGSRPPRYHQLKFAVVQSPLLTHDWFTAGSGGQHSLLQQFWNSFQGLTGPHGRPAMALQTNRQWDGRDPLPPFISGRHNKLTPRLRDAGPRTNAGKARNAWTTHLGITDDQLYEMLDNLELHTGRGSLASLREECLVAQHAAGLRPDENVLDVGVAEIARMIGEGERMLDAAGLRSFVERRERSADDRRGVLLVQALDHDPWPEAANVVLDWVDLFDGTEAGNRRQLRDPALWNAQVKDELRAAVLEMRRQGFEDVFVAGLMRTAPAFAVGYHFSDVAGFAVATRQRAETWASRGDASAIALDRSDTKIGRGDDVAIGVSISNDLSEDVLRFLELEALLIGRFVHILPRSGVGNDVIADDAAARGLARQIVVEAREAVRDAGATRVHLFLTMPKGLAVLLGNIWNALPETVVYEHLLGALYAATFRLG
jgi:hypothetical protein